MPGVECNAFLLSVEWVLRFLFGPVGGKYALGGRLGFSLGPSGVGD